MEITVFFKNKIVKIESDSIDNVIDFINLGIEFGIFPNEEYNIHVSITKIFVNKNEIIVVSYE